MKDYLRLAFGFVLAMVLLVALALVLSSCNPQRDMEPLGAATGSLVVAGTSTLNGATTINNNATVTGTLGVGGATTLSGALGVTGASTLNGATTINNNATVTGTLGVGGATTLSGASTLTGNATFGGLTILSSGAFTPTAGQTLDPTRTLYSVNSSGAVSMTLAACSNTGQMLYLYGDDDNTVTVNDSNVYTHDGSAEDFGQYDLVGWMCVGTAWVEAFNLANQ